MNVETIKTGKCPVCGSAEVYDNSGISTPSHRQFITVSAVKSFAVEVYVCMDCGYFKEFLRDDDMKNEKLKAKVKQKWNKTSEKTNAR